jgi:hypothetical protein
VEVYIYSPIRFHVVVQGQLYPFLLLKNQPQLLAMDPVIINEAVVTKCGVTTLTSSEKEMSPLIRQAWCSEKVAAPPQVTVCQANYLTTLILKQF